MLTPPPRREGPGLFDPDVASAIEDALNGPIPAASEEVEEAVAEALVLLHYDPLYAFRDAASARSLPPEERVQAAFAGAAWRAFERRWAA